MADAPAITNAQVKTQIWGTATPPSTFDTFFTQVIPQVQSIVEQITGVRFAKDSTDPDDITNEIVDGNGSIYIEAKLKPIKEVVKIETRNSNYGWDEQTDIDYSDVELEDNKIYTVGDVIGYKGSRNIRLNYTAGYVQSEVPYDLQQCLILMVVGLYNQRNSIGLKQQNILGSFQIQLDDKDHQFVERTLSKYKNVIVL